MSGSMEGKVVLIAGGSAGIGRAAAELFAKAGANVVIAARGVERGREAEKIIKGRGGNAVFVQTDVTKAAKVKDLVERTAATFGRLDYAVNNAAVSGRMARTAEFSEEDFDAEVNANLKSVWLCMKYELEQMQKQEPRGGAIVNTSSVNGLGGAPLVGLYAMAKAGILALTKSAAQEYASSGVRVNALVAGAFDTDLLQSTVSRMMGDDPAKIRHAFDSMTARIPLGRVGAPVEAAEAAVWLCSDAASYVTGHSMIVDGGLTSWAR
jgi:NAD(P)-dependent dehydrogenase (short-subunit alcohol dehydrogenase family)